MYFYFKKINIIKSINEKYLIFFLILICKKFFKIRGFMKFLLFYNEIFLMCGCVFVKIRVGL